MCDVGSIITGVAALGSAYGSKRQGDSVRNSNHLATMADNSRRNQEFAANLSKSQQQFEVQRQSAELSAQRDKEGEQAFDTALAPTEEIGNLALAETLIAAREGQLNDVIAQSDARGEQDVQSGQSFGRIGNDFKVESAEAKAGNIGKSKRRATQLADIHGVGDIHRRDAKSIGDAGLNANILRGGTHRQRQLDNFLTRIGNQRAELDNTLAPDENRIFDPTNRSAQLYSLFGQALGTYAGSTGGGRKAPSGGNDLALNTDSNFYARNASIA